MTSTKRNGQVLLLVLLFAWQGMFASTPAEAGTGTQPVTQPYSQPGSRPAIQAASQPAIQVASQAGSPAATAESAGQAPGETVDSRRTVVLIHGMFLTPDSWEDWIHYFEDEGFKVIAPPWPLHDKPEEVLRKAHPDPALGKLKLEDIVASYTKLLEGMDPKPVLIGHSMGGLVVQVLLQKHLGSAGVVIDSAPPKGVLTTHWSFIRSNWPCISPFANKLEPCSLTLPQFQYAFAHTLPLEEQKAAYDRYLVPESRQVGQAPLGQAAAIDFKAPHPPLLFIAGEKDRIIPASLNRSNFKRYKDASSITDFKEFPGRLHYIVWQRGWEEVADYVIDWINTRGAPVAR